MDAFGFLIANGKINGPIKKITMKRICFILLFAISANLCYAQVLKKIGRKVKDNVGWRAERRLGQELDKGIDSILRGKRKGEKADQRKPDAKPKTPTGDIEPGQAPIHSKTSVTKEPKGDQNASYAAGEGFITLFLSTPVTTRGLSVDLYGESIKHDKWKEVALRVEGPDVDEKLIAALTAEGKYAVHWTRLPTDGEYTITATSSDGKMIAKERLWVMDWTEPEDENKSLIEESGKAFERLKEKADAVKAGSAERTPPHWRKKSEQ